MAKATMLMQKKHEQSTSELAFNALARSFSLLLTDSFTPCQSIGIYTLTTRLIITIGPYSLYPRFSSRTRAYPPLWKHSRKGFQEERDGTRLRDGKARLVACYVCGGSPIPLRSLTTDPESSWRQIVSCDYCALHWHLDCLSPPLASMPNSGRKWMCPNHAEQVMVRRTCSIF